MIDVHVLSLGETEDISDALPVVVDKAVQSGIATHAHFAKQCVEDPRLRLIRKIKRWQSLHMSPMLFNVRRDIEVIEATIELPLQHHSKVPATLHQHEHVRLGRECRQGPQHIIREVEQPGSDCDRHGHGHLMCVFMCA
jgi:hypothetical protein